MNWQSLAYIIPRECIPVSYFMRGYAGWPKVAASNLPAWYSKMALCCIHAAGASRLDIAY